ncbi:MAG TPA: BamA/TamA family outer membrane protein [Bacteroidales bacterium]|nr:BamA/TamA family outer membrane protein [Bacteroidales bacterium]HRW97321.1 BamA/TamA family outer membrane protein [Bacteroidales bacterium]
MKNYRFFVVVLSLLLLSSCSVTHHLKENEYILVGNRIEIDKSNTGEAELNFNEDDIPGLIQQKPNKPLLGVFRFAEWIHLIAHNEKETRFKNWLDKSFGKEPVILDHFSAQRSIDQIERYLNNHGFFHSEVAYEPHTRRQKAIAEYYISLTKPYLINGIDYSTKDTAISVIISAHNDESLVKPGDIYNTSLLDDERYRITELLRNHGYFYFSPEFVYYEVDSAFGNKTLRINAVIEQAQQGTVGDTSRMSKVNHKKYFINKVSVNTEFNPLKSDTAEMNVFSDTIADEGRNRFFLYYRDKLRIKPSTIRNLILLKPGDLYTQKKEEDTYRQLSGLSLYGYTSLHFKSADQAQEKSAGSKQYLNALINMTRRPVQSFSVETEGTTSGGKLGVAGNFVYQNLNVFRGAEVLTFRILGGIEWQQGGTSQDNVFLSFNTVQTGAEVTLDFPKFVLPFHYSRMSNIIRPRTTVKFGINYQNRPDYLRYLTNAAFGYNWRYGSYISHSFIPFDLNSVSIFPNSLFVARLEQLNDPRLTNQYTDHFIMSAKYSFTYNNQERDKVKNFTYFRWSVETAGNLLQLINSFTGAKKNNDGEMVLWNIPFAQYARSDIDFRYYFALGEENTLVYRNMIGVGLPYGSSKLLPFEKGFYMGGSTDMRGWKYRSLGPGSYRDTLGTYFEKMGDIAFETNLEYRFPIYSYLKGALFADIGNVWLLNYSEKYPGGLFKFDDFLSKLAINAGFGFRFDFSFFIFRIDAAAPLKDPSYAKGDRWQINTLKAKDVIWNFGIGYPF